MSERRGKRLLVLGVVAAAAAVTASSASAALYVQSATPGVLRGVAAVPMLPIALAIPGAPSNLVATASSPTTIDLSWKDNSSDESEFRVEFHTVGTSFTDIGTAIDANTTAVTIGGASPGATYTFRVKARNASGDSGYSNEASATTPVSGGSIPAAPSGLLALASSATTVDLQWTDNSSNESEFRLEYHTPGQSFADIGTAIPANTTLVRISGATPLTTYTYRLKARNASGDSGYSNEATATTPASSSSCVSDSATLCLFGGRFRVVASYRNYAGTRGNGTAVSLTSDTGYFWFFSPANVEVVAKIVSFCGAGSNNYSLYAGGLTDVEVTLTVTDTINGTTRSYTNPLGTPFTLIRDGPFSCP